MASEKVASLWKFFGIIGIVTLLSMVIVDVADSTLYYLDTKDWRPLADSTVGRLIANEKFIKNDIAILKLREQPKEILSLIKFHLILSLLIYLTIAYLIFTLVKLILKSITKTGEGDVNPMMYVGVFLITILIIVSLELGYEGYVNGRLFIPFSGIWDLIVNWRLVITKSSDFLLSNVILESQNLTSSII